MITNPEVETTPTRLPGTCFSCGASQLSPGREWFLDTDVDYYDTPSYRIQICNICFDLLANTCGYIKKGEEVAQYKRKIAQLEEEIHELDRYRRLADLLGIDSDRLNRLLTLSEIPLGEVDDDASAAGSKKRSRTKQDHGTVGSGETGLPESSDDEGMAIVRTNKPGVSVSI